MRGLMPENEHTVVQEVRCNGFLFRMLPVGLRPWRRISTQGKPFMTRKEAGDLAVAEREKRGDTCRRFRRIERDPLKIFDF
jgi:hypothetical protein